MNCRMENTLATEASPKAHAEPVLRMTDSAIHQIKEVIAQQGLVDHFLSIRVVPAGCSGLGYDLNLEKEARPGDLIWEQGGIRLATDAMSGQYLSGTEMAYVSSATASGFKFNNPNAKSSCGCGSSFSA